MKKFKKKFKTSNGFSNSSALSSVGASVEIKLNNDDTPGTICICGAKSFKNYLPEIISINLGKKCVNISGKSLECITFSGGAVEINGDIENINFG